MNYKSGDPFEFLFIIIHQFILIVKEGKTPFLREYIIKEYVCTA